jgi:hypothetical protein
MRPLLLDEMYPPALAEQLRAASHDTVAASAMDVGLAGGGRGPARLSPAE